MKVISVVGARPQFVMAAPVCKALRRDHDEVLVHAGERYDYEMPDDFFQGLGIPKPDYNLAVGAGRDGRQTGEMLGPLEELFLELRPEAVITYGGTNTTLAAALAAAKLGIPVVHAEAGLRSFNRAMADEINRVLVDHVADLLLCPTRAAVSNLAAEGISDGVTLVGDVMLDSARFFAEHVDAAAVLAAYGLEPQGYYLATVRRADNSDNRERLASIVRAFARLSLPVVWAVHPRTAENLEALGVKGLVDASENIRSVPPVSYMETVALLSNAAGVLTDSGGMQKEAYFFQVPCVTLREETEWVETVELGWNTLTGTDEDRIVSAATLLSKPTASPNIYGDGRAADLIVDAMERRYGT